jgi:hypothetical protein
MVRNGNMLAPFVTRGCQRKYIGINSRGKEPYRSVWNKGMAKGGKEFEHTNHRKQNIHSKLMESLLIAFSHH